MPGAGRHALAQGRALLGDLGHELLVDGSSTYTRSTEMQVWPPFCIE